VRPQLLGASGVAEVPFRDPFNQSTIRADLPIASGRKISYAPSKSAAYDSIALLFALA